MEKEKVVSGEYTRWNESKIEESIYKLMFELNINTFPTNAEMRENKLSGLSRAIGKSGGSHVWSDKLDIKRKKQLKKWNSETVIREVEKAMVTLQLDRLPTRSELESIGRGDLNNAISRGVKSRGLAELMELDMKESETETGYRNEVIVRDALISRGFEVKEMTTQHPYDLLVNNSVKIEVKSGVEHLHYGSPATTFGLGNKYSACDIYICIAYKTVGVIKNIFVIPSNHAQVVTINMGQKSKYNKFIDRWDYVQSFTEFYKKINVKGDLN